MKYMDRFLREICPCLGEPTYKTYETGERAAAKTADIYRDQPTKPTEPGFVGFVGTSPQVSPEIAAGGNDRGGYSWEALAAMRWGPAKNPLPDEVEDTYDVLERAAIQGEDGTGADELHAMLVRKGAKYEAGPRGLRVTGVELSAPEKALVRIHNVMLARWTLAGYVEKHVGFPVEFVEWNGCILPESEWGSFRPSTAYQVVPTALAAPSPELTGLWALLLDGRPRVYATPWRAYEGFMRTWRKHLSANRRYRRFGKLPAAAPRAFQVPS